MQGVLAKKLLEKEGHIVTHIRTKSALFDLFTGASTPAADLVFLDTHLTDGGPTEAEELARTVRLQCGLLGRGRNSSAGDGHATGWIGVFSAADRKEEYVGDGKGLDDAIAKPLSRALLLAAIERWRKRNDDPDIGTRGEGRDRHVVEPTTPATAIPASLHSLTGAVERAGAIGATVASAMDDHSSNFLGSNFPSYLGGGSDSAATVGENPFPRSYPTVSIGGGTAGGGAGSTRGAGSSLGPVLPLPADDGGRDDGPGHWQNPVRVCLTD